MPTELHIGFTGTQRGMTDQQRARVRAWLASYAAGNEAIGHHGDCLGADAEFHEACIRLGIRVDVHPPDNPAKRAFCYGYRTLHPEKPYLARNRDIARCSQVLIAAPREPQEVTRSGTWATVRAAVRLGRDVVIFPPYGGACGYEEVRLGRPGA
jgi:hypothetical protein